MKCVDNKLCCYSDSCQMYFMLFNIASTLTWTSLNELHLCQHKVAASVYISFCFFCHKVSYLIPLMFFLKMLAMVLLYHLYYSSITGPLWFCYSSITAQLQLGPCD